MKRRFPFIYLSLVVMSAVIMLQSYFLYAYAMETKQEKQLVLKEQPVASVNAPSFDPYMQIRHIEEQMNRSFADFHSMFASEKFFQEAFKDMSLSPLSDIQENDKSYVVSLNIPGAKEQELNIKGEGNRLHVMAVIEKSSDNNDTKYVRRERYYQRFERVLVLPDDADLSAMKSEYKDGVLNIVVPKKS